LSNHTLQTEKTGRGRRFVVFGVSIPTIPAVLMVLTAGVALAAILLTTTISGQTVINEVATSNDVDVTASSQDGSALKCTVNLSADDKTLEIIPTLTKQIGGGNASGVPIPGGTCTLKFLVKNTGNTNIRVDESSILTLPAGWDKGPIEGLQQTIVPNAVHEITVNIIANENATVGSVTGKLVYTDAAA
jgi:hypothetical protein